MRANTNRERRFAFDAAADAYDSGRPEFDAEIVAALMREAHLEAGSQVLEIGAGTGQLTKALLRAGLRVDAVEPAPSLATRLRRKFSSQSALTVSLEPFEAFVAPMRYDAVVAANAFHWLDPAVSYAKACSLLRDGGALGLLWNFPILTDAALQGRLNAEALTGELADLRRDPNNYEKQLEPLLAGGREELAASGAFTCTWWELVARRWTIDRAGYVDLMNSYANAVDARALLAERIDRIVNADASLEITNYVYLCVAQP